ncbi:males-absent on the first protein-like [Senna tora]|uniref:Males-absent on the first protein-like n=1 Tax=Senna tora TaxID=362788 RepID=A0A834WPC6_9FABA|nr:males-absent on the first protein-like [Senna tora]
MAGAGASATTKKEKLIGQPNKQDPSKFYNQFLYKAVVVVIFLVIIPLIPSQAPEFVSQTLLTRNWELLHLVFVASKRFPTNSNKLKESVVLPSPIPWRSRSGRLEKKQEPEISTQYASSSSPSMEESEFTKQESRSIKSQTLRSSSRPNSMSSPKGPSPSESLAKNAEDLVRKKKSISMMKPRSSSTSLNEEASFDRELKRSFTSERGMEANSVRTVRAGGQSKNLAEENFVEEPMKHVSFRTDKLMGHGSVPLVSEPACLKFAEKEKESFLDKVMVQSDEDTETEDEEVGESFNIQKEESGESSKANEAAASSSVSDEGPDVDKKADEFIAKFREQIRLQRIESIKRSARNTRNSSRLS